MMMQRTVSSAIRASRGTALRALSSEGGRGAFLGDLAGKVVVVGGAGNPPSEAFGMGSTTALMFARAGAKVISVAHLAENCDTVTDAIKSEGLEVRLHSFVHLRLRPRASCSFSAAWQASSLVAVSRLRLTSRSTTNPCPSSLAGYLVRRGLHAVRPG